jgi:hypothetical protein
MLRLFAAEDGQKVCPFVAAVVVLSSTHTTLDPAARTSMRGVGI